MVGDRRRAIGRVKPPNRIVVLVRKGGCLIAEAGGPMVVLPVVFAFNGMSEEAADGERPSAPLRTS
jgi:hypothetical protein